MDILNTECWRLHHAELWIIMRSFDVRDAVLYRELRPPINALRDDPKCNAMDWLKEHKSAMRPKYKDWDVDLALNLAFNELVREVWNRRLKALEKRHEVWNKYLGVWEKRRNPAGSLNFERLDDLRLWIEYERPFFPVQDLVTLFPVPKRGRPKKTSTERAKDERLAAYVEALGKTGLSQRKACEAMYRDGQGILHSAEALRMKCRRVKKSVR
jgi:hypothetical protein